MGLRTIIGIDLGKFNSVVCVMGRRHASAQLREHRHERRRRPRLIRCVTSDRPRVAANEATCRMR